MSILIKGMKMPDRDHLVLVEIDSNGDVFAAYDGGRTKLTQYKASLVHEPHGRLIDADALIEDLERQCKEVFRIDAVSPDDYWITRNEAYNEALWKSWVGSFGDYLKTRPTIIEAEE